MEPMNHHTKTLGTRGSNYVTVRNTANRHVRDCYRVKTVANVSTWLVAMDGLTHATFDSRR